MVEQVLLAIQSAVRFSAVNISEMPGQAEVVEDGSRKVRPLRCGDEKRPGSWSKAAEQFFHSEIGPGVKQADGSIPVAIMCRSLLASLIIKLSEKPGQHFQQRRTDRPVERAIRRQLVSQLPQRMAKPGND